MNKGSLRLEGGEEEDEKTYEGNSFVGARIRIKTWIVGSITMVRS